MNKIKVTGVIAKLKKRCQQVTSKSANKKSLKEAMTASDVAIKCLNSKIAWEESFPKYDNREIKNIKNFNTSSVRSLAAEIESNFCVHISSTGTNDDIDAVLENFP